MFELGSGSLYILNDAEEPKKFGEVKDAKLQMWADDVSDFVVPVTGMEATFEACCKISKDFMLAILGIRDSVLDLCPNKRMAEIRKFERRTSIELLEFWRKCRWLKH